jgi:sigma-B regulation protein RsbU (phosphoserine phosphatase)
MSDHSNKRQLRALIIEDSEFDAVILAGHLQKEGYEVTWERVETAADLETALREQTWDIVFSDHQMPDFDADEALKVVQRIGVDLPFIVVSGGIGEDKAVDLMKAGAHDFVFKGGLIRLAPAVDRELRDARTRAAHRAAEQMLRENEKRLRLLWEKSPDAILMMDEAGGIAFMNPAAEEVFGCSATRLATMNAAQLLSDPDGENGDGAPEGLPWEERRVTVGGELREIRGQRCDGTLLVMEAGFSRLEFEGRTWFVAFIRDITRRRQAEDALAARDREFAMARTIQQRLYPQRPPDLPGFDLASDTRPADETGGDYFDYLDMDAADVGLVVGDVTGHGMGPALIMAETRAYLRVVAINRRDAGQVLTRANQALADDLEGSDRFVTCILVRLTPSDGSLAYANAGHVAGLVVSASGEVKDRFKRRGPPLGLFPETNYTEHAGPRLEPGDLVVILTDGFEEAETADGERFGVHGVIEVLRENRDRTAQEIVDALTRAIHAFQNGQPQQDDLTVVVLKALESSSKKQA